MVFNFVVHKNYQQYRYLIEDRSKMIRSTHTTTIYRWRGLAWRSYNILVLKLDKEETILETGVEGR
jgi:hypothetical protein